MNKLIQTTEQKKIEKKIWWRLLKFFIVLAAFSFLAYKLLSFKQYNELSSQWKQMPDSQFWWLIVVFMLLPFNWFLEAVKWKQLISKIQKINLQNSVRGVLAGISTGFFTPNRVGDLIGRVMFLQEENRKSGVTLSILNSLTQNIILVFCGIPASILYFYYTAGDINPNKTGYLILVVVSLLIFGLIYFALPTWSTRIMKSKLSLKIKQFMDCLTNYNQRDLLQIMAISFCRYIVFCIQLYFMFRFFSVDISPLQALIAIPTTYLLITFTPSFALTDAAVRSSYAVLIIGAFSSQTVNIALASVCIWMVNFVIPMLVGSVMLMRKIL